MSPAERPVAYSQQQTDSQTRATDQIDPAVAIKSAPPGLYKITLRDEVK